MKLIILLAFFFTTVTVSAQLKLKVADQYYEDLAYYKALELYEDLAENKPADNHSVRRTAECYRLLGNSWNSQVWYEKLMASGSYTNEDIYQYAQVLKRNEQYAKANEWMAKLLEKQPSHTIAKAHKENITYFTDLLKDSSNFVLVTLLELNSEMHDFSPVLYDSTTLVFTSSRKSGSYRNKEFNWDGTPFLDVYFADLENKNTIKEVESYLMKELRSKYHEGPVSFSNNNTRMYVTRSNFNDKKLGKSESNINNLKLYTSYKEAGEWSEYVSFDYNSNEYSLGHATVSKDGKKMFFTSDMPGSIGETDIWMSTLEHKEWSTPKNLGANINTEGEEMFPYYHEETGLLYFATDGHAGLGGLDIYVAYPDGNGGFENVENVGYPINTSQDDFGLILTDNAGVFGYFSSNREGGEGLDDIYAINIYEPFGSLLEMDIVAIDYETNEILPNTRVIISDKAGNPIDEVITDQAGKIQYQLNRQTEYVLTAIQGEYDTTVLNINTAEIPYSTKLYEDKLVMVKPYQYLISGLALDAKTKDELPDYRVILMDNEGNERELAVDGTDRVVVIVDGNGGREEITIHGEKQYGFGLDADTDYKLVFEKDGYIAYTQEFTTKNAVERKISIDGLMGRTGIKLENIYYDYDKHDIRQDAEATLNELISLLKEYPEMKIELGSHTDARANDSYNNRLSANRAKSAVEYLVKGGIDANRLTWKGYGESQHVNKCADGVECTEPEHQLNRRTEFRIVE